MKTKRVRNRMKLNRVKGLKINNSTPYLTNINVVSEEFVLT